tara:strand:- start:515 stop:682 length:168 start_codon:yes stop_codon:yes gene_type:complete
MLLGEIEGEELDANPTCLILSISSSSSSCAIPSLIMSRTVKKVESLFLIASERLS